MWLRSLGGEVVWVVRCFVWLRSLSGEVVWVVRWFEDRFQSNSRHLGAPCYVKAKTPRTCHVHNRSAFPRRVSFIVEQPNRQLKVF